jgi:hypothetical protein
LGYTALPAALLDKVYQGVQLTSEEQAKVDAVPDMAHKLLEHIPRLEPVIQILAALKWTDAAVAALGDGTIGLGTRILRLILEYDALFATGMSHDTVCDHLCARTTRFGPKLISQLDACIVTSAGREQFLELPLSQVTPGMTLLTEIRTPSGALLVTKGFEVTKTFLERINNFSPELLDSRVRVSGRAGDKTRS